MTRIKIENFGNILLFDTIKFSKATKDYFLVTVLLCVGNFEVEQLYLHSIEELEVLISKISWFQGRYALGHDIRISKEDED